MSRPNGVFKTENEYQNLLKNYDKMPKAVLAAIAVSYALRQVEEDFGRVEEEIMNEWRVLHSAGVVPQKPVKYSNRLTDF